MSGLAMACLCLRQGEREIGVTVDRDKIEFGLFSSSSIFTLTLHEEVTSSPRKTAIHVSLFSFHGGSRLSRNPQNEIEGHLSHKNHLLVMTYASFENSGSTKKKSALARTRVWSEYQDESLRGLDQLLFGIRD